MLLQKLDLENFGSIKKANIEFAPGFNIFSGDIGQGKSHIIYAIAYLLLNTRKDNKIDTYVRWGESRFLADLKLEHQGKNFHVRSIFEDGTNNRFINLDGFETDDKTNVLNLLKEYFDPALCKASMISFQGDADIVTATPAVRRDNLRKIYDLEFTEQIKQISDDIEALNGKPLKEATDAILILENKEYDMKVLDRLPRTSVEHEGNKSSLEAANNKIALVEKEIEIYAQKLSNKNSVENIIEELLDDIALRNGRIEGHIKESSDLNVQFDNADAKCDENVAYYNRRLAGEDFDEKKRQFETDLKALVNIRIPVLDPAVSKKGIDTYRTAISTHEIRISKLKDQVALIKQGKCPTCGQEFHDDRFNLDDLIKDCETTEKLAAEMDGQLKKAILELEAYTRACADQEMIIAKQTLLKEKIQSEEITIERTKEGLRDDIENETKNTETKKNLLSQNIQKTLDTIKDHQDMVASKNKDLEQRRKELEEFETLGDYPVVSVELTTEKQSLITQIANYDVIDQQNKVYEKINDGIIIQQADDREKLVVLKSERDKLTKEINMMEQAMVILKKDFPNYVIQNTVSNIEENTNLFLDQTYGGRYHINIKQDKAGIGIRYGSQDKDIRISSGGEQDLFNLGLKHGFCRLTNMGILMLDEVDKFMSLSMSKHMFSIINDMILDPKNEINQVLVITHKDEIKDLLESDFNGKIFRVENSLVTEE